MGKEQEGIELSGRAKGIAQDLSSLESRYYSYEKSINDGLAAGLFKDAEILARYHDGSLSVMEGLGAPQFRDHLNSQQKEELVAVVWAASNDMLQFAETNKERDKVILSTAKVEAAIKGFELPLSIDGKMQELDMHGLPQSEYTKIIDVTKQSLLEVSRQNISAEEFPTRLTSLIKEKIANTFPPQQAEAAGKIVDQGVKPSKRSKLQPNELSTLDNLASEVSQDFITILEQNRARIIVNETIKNIEEKGHKVSPKQRETIEKSLTSKITESLKDFDSQHIMNNKGVLSKNLADQVIGQRSVVSRSFGRFSVRERNLRKVKVPNEYLKDTKKLLTKKALPTAGQQQPSPKQDRRDPANKAPAPPRPARSNSATTLTNTRPEQPARPLRPKTAPPIAVQPHKDNVQNRAELQRRNTELSSAKAAASIPAPIAKDIRKTSPAASQDKSPPPVPPLPPAQPPQRPPRNVAGVQQQAGAAQGKPPPVPPLPPAGGPLRRADGQLPGSPQLPPRDTSPPATSQGSPAPQDRRHPKNTPPPPPIMDGKSGKQSHVAKLKERDAAQQGTKRSGR